MCADICRMNYGELTKHQHMYTYNHDIALVDQGGTKTTFECVLMLRNNVVVLLLIKSVIRPTLSLRTYIAYIK